MSNESPQLPVSAPAPSKEEVDKALEILKAHQEAESAADLDKLREIFRSAELAADVKEIQEVFSRTTDRDMTAHLQAFLVGYREVNRALDRLDPVPEVEDHPGVGADDDALENEAEAGGQDGA